MRSMAQIGNDLYSGKTSVPFIPRRKLWLSIGIAGMIFSLLMLGIRGLNPGIEFRGGAEFTVSETKITTQSIAQDIIKEVSGEDNARVSVVGKQSLRIQTKELTNEQTLKVRGELAKKYSVPEANVTSSYVGPSWGKDVSNKALQGLITFIVIVSLVLALYFRTWTMSLAAMLALLHDIVFTVGFFALTQVEVTPATVIGFLTILGYSLYDNVVVFDKIRENTANFMDQKTYTYQELTNLSVNQTLIRSINTSVVGILPVASVLIIGTMLLGAGTLLDISLALFVGQIVGTLSSIFIASPILTLLRERQTKCRDHTAMVLKLREKHAQSVQDAGDAGEGGVVLAGKQLRVAPMQRGEHLGHQAQPRRKKK